MQISEKVKRKLMKISFSLIFFLLPLTTSAYTSFPTKIDTLQERINIQVVLNKVMNPSPNLVVDGVIGRKSIQAIQSFQESRGLVPDGKVGPITRNALETSQTGTTSTPTNTTTTNTTPTTTSSNTNTSTISTTGCISGGLYNIYTGKPCITISSTLGCTSSTKYSPVTGVYCGNTTTQTTTTTNTSGGGGEGSSTNINTTDTNTTNNTNTSTNINNCTGSSTQSCIIGNGSGTQSRTCASSYWTSFNSCAVSTCNTGYQISGNSCVVIPTTSTIPATCTGSATQSCSIGNGTGIQSRTCTNGTWSAFNSCTVSSCNNGYQISGNTCVVIPTTPTTPISDAKIINVTASFQGTAPYVTTTTLDRIFTDTTYWAAEGDGQWITYELDKIATVSYVRLAFYSTSQRYFEIQYSTNGTTWTNATSRLTSAGNMANQYQTFSFSPVNAKYIRIVGHGSSTNNWNSIIETDINGFAVALTSTPPVCTPES